MEDQRLSGAGIVGWTFRFWCNHGALISGCMLLAALGRASQMRIFGPIPSSWSMALEVVVEFARIVTLLVIIGHGNPGNGFRKMAGIFRFNRQKWNQIGRKIRTTLRQQWAVLFWNLLVFSLIAYGINQMNEIVARYPVVLDFLKYKGWVHASATDMPLVFFLKNLTVIPFTLVFDYGLVRWLTGNLTPMDYSLRPEPNY